jgi:hypothetical protein
MSTILGTLRRSADSPIFPETTDKPRTAVTTISVVLLCRKRPSKVLLSQGPSGEKRRIITAPASEMETVAIYVTGCLGGNCRKASQANLPRVSHLPDSQSTFYPLAGGRSVRPKDHGQKPKATAPAARLRLALALRQAKGSALRDRVVRSLGAIPQGCRLHITEQKSRAAGIRQKPTTRLAQGFQKSRAAG